ncbi:MAG TPA: DNA-protecting protein DprA [Deltaproteobacteria bacterium]|nr:DNA-protecting protein DprA [Deltaproteobacteria bacterium]
MDEKLCIIALSRLKGIKAIEKKETIQQYGYVAPLFKGKKRHHDQHINEQIISFKDWKTIERELSLLEKMNVQIITIKDNGYPELLRNIPDAPILLYTKGSLYAGKDTLAIVGSRRATFEGINLAEKIAQTLSSLGITIVSGLARGIDSASHKGALKEKGKTIAVLGCGIDICYPPENKTLFERIGKEGIIITEYGPGEKPLSFHFPERNRIIAGLSRGVLVIEASQRSGSLITARLGIEYGREVMAIPGSIFNEEYRGANALIKEGAKLIDGIEDILVNCFPDVNIKREQTIDMDRDEEYIYSLIGHEKIHIDEIIEKSQMDTKRVISTMTRLEMKDVIRGFPGGFYIRR